jgi:uncharacterized membrane protein
MDGSLVYSNVAIASTDGVISFNHHTRVIYIHNNNSTTDANVKLNGKYIVHIPHTPNQASGHYICIPGDYTTLEVLTANVNVAIMAIG